MKRLMRKHKQGKRERERKNECYNGTERRKERRMKWRRKTEKREIEWTKKIMQNNERNEHEKQRKNKK